jgi:toxin ParE1/3/4
MKVVWTRRAIRDLTRARSFLARENPSAASETAMRIIDAVDTVSRQPRIGRVGRIAGTREYVVAGTPYILIYRLYERYIQLLHVFHSRREWPSSR